MTFLTEILNSKFNLITDIKLKKRIIDVLGRIPGDDMAEKLLRSYLYLMIGNVARSDNILRDIVKSPPFENWKGFSSRTSVYHRVVRDNLVPILAKLSRHPSDRKSYELFNRYLREFFNDSILLDKLSQHELNQLDGKMAYQVVTRVAPDFTQYIRLNRMSEAARMARLREKEISSEFKAYWVWYFFPVTSLITDESFKTLEQIEKDNPLWLIYLLENERLSDIYISKKGGNHLSQTRTRLRSYLKQKDLFMLSLFKLIEMGDIDEALVRETLDFVIHE